MPAKEIAIPATIAPMVLGILNLKMILSFIGFPVVNFNKHPAISSFFMEIVPNFKLKIDKVINKTLKKTNNNKYFLNSNSIPLQIYNQYFIYYLINFI